MSEDEANDMARRIDEVLHKNSAHIHLVNVPQTPLEHLLYLEGETEEEEIRADERLQSFRALLSFVFQSGPEPLRVLRNIFAIAKAVRPELIGDMSLEDISIICADGGRATVSARIQRIYNDSLKKGGIRVVPAAFQKSGDFSEPQKGNQNRRKKPAKLRAKRKK